MNNIHDTIIIKECPVLKKMCRITTNNKLGYIIAEIPVLNCYKIRYIDNNIEDDVVFKGNIQFISNTEKFILGV